jgi:hypothetical protein
LKVVTRRLGVQIRVKPEVDELVREIAVRLGYYPYTIRNLALLLGIQQLVLNPRIPKSDMEMEMLLAKTRRLVKTMLVVEKIAEEKG